MFALFACDSRKAEVVAVGNHKLEEKRPLSMTPVIDKTIRYADYIKWYYSDESGMMFTKELDGVMYNLIIKNPLIRRIESSLKNKQSKISIDSASLIYEFPDLHCMMKVEIPDKRYLRRLKTNLDVNEYLAFGAESDFFLIANSDTIIPNLYHYENVYPHAPYLSFLMSFPLRELTAKPELFFVFMGDSAGVIKTKIPTDALYFIPKFSNQ